MRLAGTSPASWCRASRRTPAARRGFPPAATGCGGRARGSAGPAGPAASGRSRGAARRPGPARPACARARARSRNACKRLGGAARARCRRRWRPARSAAAARGPSSSCRARSTSRRTSSSFGVASRPGAAARARRHDHLRPRGRLDDQRPRRDHGGQLRVAELLQQAEHVAVDRLLPDVLPRVEVAADADARRSAVSSAAA